ncbi:hypothetical protein FQN51_005442 [Onygenales sp. PD_10]|nr:hypothetical protein FQN51_005442 [Onygenales sp. PD_10]
MAHLLIIAAAIFSGLLSGVVAQGVKTQVNVSISSWNGFRASIIRDKIYLDGGYLWWLRGNSDGTYGDPDSSVDPDGLTFMLSLTVPFDTTKTNLTSLFTRLPITEGAANNVAPPTMYGAMFANDYKLGLIRSSDLPTSFDADKVIAYERYQYGAAKTSFEPGFRFEDLNNDVTRYITSGAAVSAPSENKGFYFSGNHRQNWDEIKYQSRGKYPNITSDKLISVDMADMLFPKWSNASIPDYIPGRAAGELVWIPVSPSGVLIAIGGVPHPSELVERYTDKDLWKENEQQGREAMRSVPVYDIDTRKWYMQNTTGDYPPQLANFCSVVATAQDGSSHNIYIYGGSTANTPRDDPFDDVYVLSVPSFTWIHVYKGDAALSRQGHKCVKPFPDQMLVLGGQHSGGGAPLKEIIRVYNLNTLKFQNTYHPAEYVDYEVPALVTDKIGGDGKGGATVTSPSSWVSDDLRDVFSKKYTKPIKTYYPYPVENATSPAPTSTTTPSNGSGLPKWVAPVLGVVLGLIFITGLAVLWLMWRRRRDRKYAPSEGPSSDNRNRIMGWMYGMGLPTHKTHMTTASTEIGINDKHTSTLGYSEAGESAPSAHPNSGVVYSPPLAQEAAGTQVHEMQAGTVSAPLEMPTEYNVAPASPRGRVVSDTPSFISPVSPEPPSPQPNPNSPPQQPTHGRHHSSISSAGFNLTLNNASIAEEQGSPRRGYVSGFTEDLPSPETHPADRNRPDEAR